MKKFGIILVFFVITISFWAIDLNKINIPENFHIEIYAKNIKGARTLAFAEKGTIFVGTRTQKLYAVIDTDNDFKADKIITVADNLNQPNGIDYYKGNLYVAEVNRILVFENIMSNLKSPQFSILYDDLPEQTHHEWRYLKIGPDGKIYISIGAPCNVCLSENKHFASICRLDLDGTNFEIFARGIRNSVGFDWHPETETLWFTDNGRDWLGDNIPPDELNKAENQNLHFGFPFIHGENILDPKYGKKLDNNKKYIKPVVKLGPHVASLGMRFYNKNQFPEEYYNTIFIAEHGSWNRSTPIGYRVTNIKKINNQYEYTVFADGWLKDNKKFGRPVDVEVINDGSLIVSDDKNGYLYRIYYKK
ncbi:MAG: sorbosone dehydrogenase family protein [Candidatus Mcinerneyibacterium aminivorans]|uniref:Sorbosone dehydrogenase family protein n=1 Tax=Candidatus Mcinerneyibacterium aminivorans TaxID=2703815 RepID=A0A5D0MDG3_9BACT|nr:MAG: sorbosone dehydrogenase family protein [Candidatus Mcinerneyibacterium aminivorans]